MDRTSKGSNRGTQIVKTIPIEPQIERFQMVEVKIGLKDNTLEIMFPK